MIFTSTVISGMGIGHKIGFPTVNVKALNLGVGMEFGVYAVMARAVDPEYAQLLPWTPALMHYGPKPTFDVEKIYCEIHFLSYPIEGAPKELEIATKGFIRGIQKFDGPESLVAQMNRDKVFAQENFFQKTGKGEFPVQLKKKPTSLRSLILGSNSPILLTYHKLKAMIAAYYYGFPARKLRVIGVTGTNGKTTVVNLITNVLVASGKKVGMTSTVNFRLGDETWMNATKMSTQSPFFIQKFLKQMVDTGCTHAVLEVTSHALVQSRTWGVDFDTVLLTNVTGDHIEYHGGFEEYREAKTLLFKNLLTGSRKSHTKRISILNADDASFPVFDVISSEEKMTYGLKAGTCFASNIILGAEGTDFTLHTPAGEIGLHMNLPGVPNVYNALSVACVALSEKISLDIVKDVFAQTEPVPGRYELVQEGQPFHVVVDYAHNIDAINGVLTMYSEITKSIGSKLIVVFGATGGGRDKAKRPVIGKLLDQYTNVIILTSDDPYEEDEWEIITMVAEGITRDEGDNYWKIPSRREAIRVSLFVAEKNDIVLIAGKGAEPVQMIYGQRREWDDREVVRNILHELH